MSEVEGTVVTPFVVKGKIDYEKLIRDFGSSPIDYAILERMERYYGVYIL